MEQFSLISYKYLIPMNALVTKLKVGLKAFM